MGRKMVMEPSIRPTTRESRFDNDYKPSTIPSIREKDSAIRSALSTLTDKLLQINSKIDKLDETIAPILRRPQAACGDDEAEKGDTVNSQLLIELTYMINLAIQVNGKIEDLIDRTQL